MAEAGVRAVPITPETVTRRQLPNGAVVLVRESHAHPALTVRGYLPAGVRVDPPGRDGLAVLAASMLTRGTARHTSQELALELDSMGASVGVSADIEGAGFSARCLAEDAERVLELLTEVLLRPTFPPEEVEKQRGKIITAIRESRLDTRAAADKAFRAAAFPHGHPHHRPAEGEEETVAAVTRDDLAAFHRQRYRPDGLVVTVVGDAAAEWVVDRLARAFEGWGPAAAPAPPPVPAAGPAPSVQRRRVEIPGKTQADVVLGVPGFPRTSPDYYAGMMADLILGRLGLMGRLGARVRDEEGLAYYVYSQAQGGFFGGPWAVRAGVNPANVARAIEGILREIEGFHREPARGDELRDARDYLTGSLALRLETDGGIAQALLELELFDLGLDYLPRFPALINGVTPEQMGEVARRYLRLDGYTVATAVPA
ncbi:MAG TPA: pitrilysin family protein [bacterium]|nr:pitrilysin family protein [bacterium]